MRSKLEASLQNYLEGKGFHYEKTKVYLVRTHIPDFYNEDTGTIVEVKGVADQDEKSKFLKMKDAQFSHVEVITNAITPEIKECLETLKSLCHQYRVTFTLYKNPPPFRYVVASQSTKLHIREIKRGKRSAIGFTTPQARVLSGKDLYTWLVHNGFNVAPVDYEDNDLLRLALDKSIV